MILGNENNQRNIITYINLYKTSGRELSYKKILLIMQTIILALQKVKPLATHWQIAISSQIRFVS